MVPSIVRFIKHGAGLLLIGSILFFSICPSGCELPDVTEEGLNPENPGGSHEAYNQNTPDEASHVTFHWNNLSIVETKYGKLEGKLADNGTWAFLSVPFAKPPVNGLRWRAPQDPFAWEGIKDASEYCSICPQYGNVLNETGEGTFKGEAVGHEDCLYMNIYRPETAETLPVMVFFHGGVNYIGRQDRSYFNGKYFVKKSNMILVTVNYRLGMMGWFSHPLLRTGDPLDDSGNFGTLDTIKALEWIHENIASFGGDPENVTVCGQSAGAWNAIALMVSPLAEGLFHKVILMSGQPTSESVKSAENSASSILKRLLIQDQYIEKNEDADDFIRFKGRDWINNYLRSKEIDEIYHSDVGGPSGMPLDKNFCTGPIVDGYVVPLDPKAAFASGDYYKIPAILGCTKDEFKLFIPLMAADPDDLFQVIEKFDPDNPQFYIDDLLKPIMMPVLAVYEPINLAGKLLNQLYGTDSLAKQLKKNQEDVYLYKFSWDEEPEPFDFLFGAAHSIDLPFFFGMFPEEESFFRFAWSEENRAGREMVSDAMISYFAQFARTGNPNSTASDLPLWTQYDSSKNGNKRIVFDTDGPRMSATSFETGEVLSLKSVLCEIMALF
ncbi:MAG: carboxylesterase family protein [Proteobacteria bacterium]|nr:carboxylesterase family protein [Pseudomonadota bacterium]